MTFTNLLASVNSKTTQRYCPDQQSSVNEQKSVGKLNNRATFSTKNMHLHFTLSLQLSHPLIVKPFFLLD